MNARPRLPKNSGSTLWVQVPEPVCRIWFSSSFKSSEGEVLLWLFWNPRGWYLKQWTISFNSKELAGRQGTKLGWSCGLVPTPSKHSLQARVSKNLVCDPAHCCLFSDTLFNMCKWSKSNQCFQVVATLHPQAPQAPQARQAFLVGSQLDGIPTIDISELRRQLLTDPLATHGFRPFSCLAKPFHWRGRSSSLIRPKNVTWNIKIPKMSLGMPEAFHQRQEKGCILHLLSHTRLAAACNWVTIAAIVANRLTQEGVLRANLEPMKSYAFQDVSSFILRMIVPIVSNCTTRLEIHRETWKTDSRAQPCLNGIHFHSHKCPILVQFTKRVIYFCHSLTSGRSIAWYASCWQDQASQILLLWFFMAVSGYVKSVLNSLLGQTLLLL